jgi:hypothetical protein
VFRHKLYQHIDVAFCVVLMPDERTEEAEPLHPELFDLVCMVLEKCEHVFFGLYGHRWPLSCAVCIKLSHDYVPSYPVKSATPCLTLMLEVIVNVCHGLEQTMSWSLSQNVHR